MKVVMVDGELGIRMNLTLEGKDFPVHITRNGGKAFAETLLDVINGKLDHASVEVEDI